MLFANLKMMWQKKFMTLSKPRKHSNKISQNLEALFMYMVLCKHVHTYIHISLLTFTLVLLLSWISSVLAFSNPFFICLTSCTNNSNETTMYIQNNDKVQNTAINYKTKELHNMKIKCCQSYSNRVTMGILCFDLFSMWIYWKPYISSSSILSNCYHT